jgi:hypothetical protein
MEANATYYGSLSLQASFGVYGVAREINASFPEYKRTENHHLLPREFEDEFANAGLDIEGFRQDIPYDVHKDIHGRGGGKLGRTAGIKYGRDSLITIQKLRLI